MKYTRYARYGGGSTLMISAAKLSKTAHSIGCIRKKYIIEVEDYAADLTERAFGLVLELASYGKLFKDTDIASNIRESEYNITKILTNLDTGLDILKEPIPNTVRGRNVDSRDIEALDSLYPDLDFAVKYFKRTLGNLQKQIKKECSKGN